MRKPLIAGNWKMNTNREEAESLAADLVKTLANEDLSAEVLGCPPFVSLVPVAEKLATSSIALGAQNMCAEADGAFTGEISGRMLTALGCRYVILGHSERRQLFGETDEIVHAKVLAALANGLLPIICVGETEAQREAGETKAHIRSQVESALQGLDGTQVANLVIAYEPIWAIGTGKTATDLQAQEVCAMIRRAVAELYDLAVADGLRILYGGSVKAANIAQLMAQEDIDGALVGGASLQAGEFAAIAKFEEE